MEFWDNKIECMDREKIEQIQLERLQATLNRVYKNVSHYRKTFREIDFMPEDLRSLEDFYELPFTTRQVLRDNYPYGMFAVPLREVVRLHAPALNPDKPVVMGFTANDLNLWGQLMARGLTSAGTTKDDVVHVALVPGKLIGPFGVQLGAELIGASVIPMSVGKLLSQVKIIRDFRVSMLVSTPSFALGIIKSMESLGVDPMDLGLKAGVFGSEPWSESSRIKIEEGLQLSAFDTYGLAEIFGPGVAWECSEKKGLHIYEDHFIPEIIDPVSLKVLPPGSKGELVLTTISKEAFPLIRFRTGDIAKLNYEICACGLTHCRISRVFERCDEVVVLRGTCVVPGQIGRALSEISGSSPNFQIVVEKVENKDQMTILIEMTDANFFDEMKKQRKYIEDLYGGVSELLGWDAKIKLVESGTFDINTKVIDKRCFD